MKSILAVTALLAATATPALAADTITVGNSAISRSEVDGAFRQTFILNQSFSTAGYRVMSFSFYSLSAGSITPLLFSRSNNGDSSTFSVVGRGQSRTVVEADTAYTFDFGLTSGSDVTGAATYFGFENAGRGVIAFDYADSADDPEFPDFFEGFGRFQAAVSDENADIFVTENSGTNNMGDSYEFDASFSTRNPFEGRASRIYSVNATSSEITAAGAVPEPATWGMMILGFGVVGASMRRRKSNVRTTVSFA